MPGVPLAAGEDRWRGLRGRELLVSPAWQGRRMTPANFIAFAQARHGEQWIQPMADETGYSYDQIYGIAAGR